MRKRSISTICVIVLMTALPPVVSAQGQTPPPAIVSPSAPNPTTVMQESDSEHVTQCAEVRDSLLMSYGWGVRLADFYYRFSPYALAAITHGASEGNSQTRWLVDVGIRCLSFALRHPIVVWSYLSFLLFPALAALGNIARGRMTLRVRERVVVLAWGVLWLASGLLFLFLKLGLAGGNEGNPGAATPPEKLPSPHLLSPAIARSYAQTRRLTVEDLAACLRHPSADVRYEAAYIAARSPSNTYEMELIRALQDSDLRVRRWAATGLATLRSQAAFDELVKLLKDPHAMVRYKAAYALGKARDRRAVAALKEKLADENEYLCVRIFAFQALDRILSGSQK